MPFVRALALVFATLFAGTGVNAQSLEQMAGQMIMVGFQGDRPGSQGFMAVRRQIAAGEIGGVMYLRTNIRSLPEVRAMNGALRAASAWMPPFIALDQEGGQIRRLTEAVGFSEIPSAETIGRGSVSRALDIYSDLAARLAELGFTVNFGPVVDLNLNPDNPIIARYERSFGSNPSRVVQMASAFVEGHRAAGLATSLKHFPGHGSSRGDTHDGFVDVSAVWDQSELDPYRQMIAADLVDMVMAAHIYNGSIGGSQDVELPASLSPDWIGGVLRGDLGYEGVVISDDLEMAAVREHFNLRETIVRAVMAGNDILLFSNTAQYDPVLGRVVRDILVQEAQNDPALATRVAESYKRILALKSRLGTQG